MHRLCQDQVLVYEMESKGVPLFRDSIWNGEEPLICNPKRIGIVHDWKNFLSKPLQSKLENRTVPVSRFVNMSSERIRIHYSQK